jgi:hypothetical protein
MKAKIGRLLCRLGDRLLGLGERLLGVHQNEPPVEHHDRPVAAALDHDALTAAAGMLAAIDKSDDQGFTILAKHSEPKALTFALCFLVIDALSERGTDLGAYTEELFDRLARRRQ